MSNKLALMIVSSLIVVMQALPANAQQSIVIDQSQPLVAPDDKVMHIAESIDLLKGQETLQLTLIYYNGTETAPGFKWLRISSPSMSYVTEAQFAGPKTFSMNVTGDLTWGGNQLLITASGPKGATFGWKLTTAQPSVTNVTSDSVNPGGAVVITGSNFASGISGNVVTIGGKTAQVVSASSTKIVANLPEDSESGAQNVSVSVAGISAGGGTVTAAALPYLKSMSAPWAAPASQVTINGSGFSPDANANVVMIGPFQANVVSSTPTSITVVVPGALSDIFYGPYKTVTVRVNGIRARNTLSLGSWDL